MKEEVKRWLSSAKEDCDTAGFNLQGKRYKYATFLCQQAVEKALKALLLNTIGSIRKIHDLVELSREAGLPEALRGELKELTIAYIYSRYPDVSEVVDLKKKAKKFVKISERVLKWVEHNL